MQLWGNSAHLGDSTGFAEDTHADTFLVITSLVHAVITGLLEGFCIFRSSPIGLLASLAGWLASQVQQFQPVVAQG